MEIFLDGLLLVSSPSSATWTLSSRLHRSPMDVTVGRCHVDDPVSYRGRLGGVYVWKRPLAQWEVRFSMFQAGWDVHPEDEEDHSHRQPGATFVEYFLGTAPSQEDVIVDYVSVVTQTLSSPLGKEAAVPTVHFSRNVGGVQSCPTDAFPVASPVTALVWVTRRSWPKCRALLSSLLATSSQKIPGLDLKLLIVQLEDGAVPEIFPPDSCTSVHDLSGRDMKLNIHVLAAPERSAETSWSSTMNAAVRTVTTTWFVTMDPNLQLSCGWLAGMWAQARAGTSTAGVTARLLYPQGLVRHAGLEFHIAGTLTEDIPLPFHRLRGLPLNHSPTMQAVAIAAFEPFLAMWKTEKVLEAGGWRAEFEPRFHSVDLCLRLGAMNLKLMYAPKGIAFRDNPEEHLPLDKPADYMFADASISSFSRHWKDQLFQVVAKHRVTDLRVQWVMHCGGSQGQEAAFLVRGFESAANVRLGIRRYDRCDYSASLQTLPAAHRDMIERLRLRTFAPEKNQVIVYHRDYRELGDYIENPTGAYLIGRYMFEADGIHTQWAEQCKQLDELWVPSEFHVKLFASQGVPKEKIYKVPEALELEYYDINVIEPAHIPGRKKFVFFAVFKMEERKGWKELIQAYFQEFTGDEDVSLVIHTHLLDGDNRFSADRILDRIIRYASLTGLTHDSLPHVKIIGRQLESHELLRFFRAADAYVMPSHGEGWGFPYMEAMALGKPVIATRWSAMTEFMNDDVAYLIDVAALGPSDVSDPWFHGFRWAQPSVPHLRTLMRTVFKSPEEARFRGARARDWIRKHFTIDVVGDTILSHLRRIELARGPSLPLAVPRPVDTSIAVFTSPDFRLCRSGLPLWSPSLETLLRSASVLGSESEPDSASGQESRPDGGGGGVGGAPGERVRWKAGGSRPRVAIVSSFPPRMCGVATFTRNMLEALNAAAVGQFKYDVYALAVEVHHDKYDPSIVKGVIRANNLEDYQKALASINAKSDLVLLQHEFALFGGHSGAFVVCLLRSIQAPVVTVLHTVHEHLDDNEHGVLTQIFKLSTRVVVMNSLTVRYLDVFHAIPATNVEVIPHGAPDLEFQDSAAFKRKRGWRDNFVIMTAGLMHPGKGLGSVVDAMTTIVKAVPNALLVIAGSPHPVCGATCSEHYMWLRDCVARRDLIDSVVFIDKFQSDDDLVSLVQACDVYLTTYTNGLTSSSGMGSLALGAGRAIVSTPFTWAREALANHTGVFVDFEDAPSIASAIIRLARDPEQLNKVRSAAYHSSRAATWPSVAQRYLQMFRGLLGNGSHSNVEPRTSNVSNGS